VIAIIPARGGSTRIPRKNIKEFHGKPIIQYSIETAEKSGLFDQIIVSTDDDEIASISHRLGATIYHREKALADNDVGTQEVARDVLKNLEIDSEYACVIYATAPLLTVSDLSRGLKYLKSSRSLNYAFSTDFCGTDVGNYYWGKTSAFVDSAPLNENSIHVPITPDRTIDINTPADWMLATTMYKELSHGE
jgi:CMP-N-acetylneuraminic acid synthetase